ncbi:MAG TPA: hypothetical protein VFD38_04640 [Myxococcaceae bacterium]|nr:hypothetical protein [Myxococcaceae bacterium]
MKRLADRRLPALPTMAFRVEGPGDVGSGAIAELRAVLVDTLRQAAAASVPRRRAAAGA